MRDYICVLLAVVLPACNAAGVGGADQDQTITNRDFLSAPLWEDGQAEVAFYRLRRTGGPPDAPSDREILVGTYLVKHDYDPDAEAKAGPDARETVASFKSALFYEFESGSYEYKRSYVVNARRADLRPLKASFTSFDWCSNLYREQSFNTEGRVDYLMRSDDYGNAHRSYPGPAGTYPVALLPLLVRSLDLSTTDARSFGVLLDSGEVVSAVARLAGRDSVRVPAGDYAAERIDVTYDRSVPSPIADESDLGETYWRGTGADRMLLAVEGNTGHYRMALEEAVRSPYWEEDVYDQLERVTQRP